MKNNLSHLWKIILSLLMVVSLVNATGIQNVNAATLEITRDTSGWVTRNNVIDNLGCEHYYGAIPKDIFTMGTKYAYCVESDVLLQSSQYSSYSNATNIEDVLTTGRTNNVTTWQEKYELLQHLMTMIPNTIEDDDKTEWIHYLAAQTLIWEITGEERDANFNYVGVTYPGASAYIDQWNWTDSAAKTEFYSYYNACVAKMKTYNTIPSFSADSISDAKTYEFDTYSNGQYSLTLMDTNGVLSNYDFSASGYTITQSGNKLTITTTSSSVTSATVTGYNDSDSLPIRAALFWTAGSSQKVVTVGSLEDPTPSAYFKVNLSIGSLELTKVDNKGNYIANTSFKVSYNSDMSDPIGTYTTGSDGKVLVEVLNAGTVYVQETSVPDNLVLDSTIHKVTITAGETATFTNTNNWKQGYIQITKVDSKTGETVSASGNVVATITTVDGVAKSGLLDYETYKVYESSNPDNYVLATTTKSQSITEDGATYKITINDQPVAGTINLTKEDSETGSTAQGDATLVGATYVLTAAKDILNPATGEVLFEEGETISAKAAGNSTWGDTGEKTTDENAEISWSNLPMGNYTITETDPSTGYLLDETSHTVTLTPENNTVTTDIESVTSKEDVIKGKLQIAKAGTDGESGVIDGLENVQFTVKLYSEVQSVGWDEATTYDVMTTDSTGRATSVDLPYGTYIVRETYTPENYSAGGDFFVTIDEDGEVEFRMVNNTPFKAWLKLVKTDEDGNTVTLSNATFKLKDSDGNYVVQKSGQEYISEWTTDEDGIAILTNMVYAGVYTVCEITSPEGLLLADELEIEISSISEALTFDEDNDPVITINVIDEKPTGTIIFIKSTENEEDIANQGIKFQLTANSDIVDPADGSVIYYKGDVVTIDNEDGIYEID